MSLDDTLGCGQCFRWTKDVDGSWRGIAWDKPAKILQQDDTLIFVNIPKCDVEAFWIDYFDLERDYSAVAKAFAEDEYLSAAAEFGKGIHILHQNPAEALISFIISSNNNISRIKKIIDAFCSIYGKKTEYMGKTYYAFPTTERLADVTVEDIAPIRAGFRDKYIYDASQKLSCGEISLEAVGKMTTAEAAAELMKIKGIGQKVADCILLFGFARYEVFPKDVWIKRVMHDVYGEGFDERVFGENAGIIQQYFYHYARNFRKE